jgi:hypothetical protein
VEEQQDTSVQKPALPAPGGRKILQGGIKSLRIEPWTMKRLRREVMESWKGDDEEDGDAVEDDSTVCSPLSDSSEGKLDIKTKLATSMQVAKIVSEDEAHKRFSGLHREVGLDERLMWGQGIGLPNRARIGKMMTNGYEGKSTGIYTHNIKESLSDIDFIFHGGMVPCPDEQDANMVEMYREYFRNIKVRISVIGALRKVGVGSLETDIADDCPRLHIHGGVLGNDVKHGFGEMNDGEFLSMATVSALATFERTKFILNSSDGETAWMIKNKRIMAEVLEVACLWTAARITHAAEGVNKMGPNKSTLPVKIIWYQC